MRREEPFGRSGRRTKDSRVPKQLVPFPRVLIVCEGTKTEPEYFKMFRIRPPVRQIVPRGTGRNTKYLVEEAERIEKVEELNGVFDEVWCVFDRDGFKPDDYDNALEMIHSKNKGRAEDKYFAAYTNEAFELWFILHFEYLHTAVTRDDYKKRLTVLLKRKYEKNKVELFRLVQKEGDEDEAIKRADELLKLYADDVPHSQRCPSTNVHKLVRRLRDWEKESLG